VFFVESKADSVLEIAWRKELVKRLQSPMNSLTRKITKEQELKQKRLEELKKYSTPEEAHDAYGYGYITWDEYEQIRQDFDTADKIVSPVEAARDELQSIIARLASEIRYFEWDKLSDAEKLEIEQKNEEWRNNRTPSKAT